MSTRDTIPPRPPAADTATDQASAQRPAGTARRPAARSSLVAVSLARTRLEIVTFFREKDALIWTLLYPVILLGIFGAVFDDDVAPGLSFAQYFLAGMVATGFMLVSFQQLAITITMEREDGTLKRLEATPMPRTAYFIGKIGAVLVTGVAQMALLLGVAVLMFDVELPTEAARWWTFAWVTVLGIAAGSLLGIAYSSVPRSAKSASSVVTAPLLILQFISGVFFMFSQLPSAMQTVAALFPLKWMAQGMRSVFLPDQFAADEVNGTWEHGMTAVVLGVWIVVGLALCLTTFRWRRRDDE